jgi:hypothetical protein
VVEDGVVNLLSTPWEQEVWFTYAIYIKVDWILVDEDSNNVDIKET